jgi:hypothetical protein
MYIERRTCLRHKVHGPIFASFDGVTGGMILDLSEQGLSMQTAVPLTADQKLHLRLDLPRLDQSNPGLPNLDPLNHDRSGNTISDSALENSDTQLETTGYIAWADALGRAGVRFSDLPVEARQRLDQWLALNDEAPSRKAPKLTLDRTPMLPRAKTSSTSSGVSNLRSISLEAESYEGDDSTNGSDAAGPPQLRDQAPVSNTIQYEFHSLGPDLNAALRIISERACTLLRGSGAAIALIDRGFAVCRELYRERRKEMPQRDSPNGDRGPSRYNPAAKGEMLCRASVGAGGPPLGTRVDINSGFSGECVRAGKALRCDDAETDSRVVAEICHRLHIRSIAAAPIRYEREVVGLVEVFSPNSFAFDEGDLAVLERLAQTALLTVSQSHLLNPM